jgi:hypothetical protein
MAKLAIDFDGVLHDYLNPLEGKSWGPPIEGAQKALRFLKNEEGHEIIIFSCKPVDVIEQWMLDNDMPFDSITNKKPEADCYIDDKAIRFHAWNLVLASLKWNLPEEVGGERIR